MNRFVHCRFLVGLCLLWLTIMTGCATRQLETPPDEMTVRATEAMLADAGFTKLDIDEPSDELQESPHFKLNQHQTEIGNEFWYYDPAYCECLYEGDQLAADRYAMEVQQQKDLAQYQSDYESEESAAQQAWLASAYNGGVPSPYFWGGWYGWYGCGMGYYYCGGAPPPYWGGGSGNGGGGHHGGGGSGGGHGHAHGTPPGHTTGPRLGGGLGGHGGGGHHH